MSLPLRTLPIVERWDCQGCAACCRGSIIPLSEEDLTKLQGQKWEEHPDFRATRLTVREGWLGSSQRLAKRDDGSCIFLSEAGRCRIHEKFGSAAKPFVCRMFPLQVVPLEKFAFLTLRRSCPSAAADEGRPVNEHLKEARQLIKERKLAERPSAPPRITRRLARRSWPDALRVADTLEQLVCDDRWPLVRRLVHAAIFCRLMNQAQLAGFEGARLGELLAVLQEGVPEEVGDLFQDRQPPGRAAAVLFRQTASEYVRLHPKFGGRDTWLGRLQMTGAAFRIVRGRGMMPKLHPEFPDCSFADLERPLGHLSDDVLGQLDRYYRTLAASKQYAVLSRRGWSLTERLSAVLLTFPLALWLLRYTSIGRAPTAEDTVLAVTTIERSHGFEPLAGRRHRSRIGTLIKLEQLERLIIWYAR